MTLAAPVEESKAVGSSGPSWRWRLRAVACLCLVCLLAGMFLPTQAVANEQPDLFTRLIFIRDLSDRLSAREQRALASFRQGRMLDARSQAEALLVNEPASVVGYFLMAYTLRHAEGELIRALRYLRRALVLYKAQINRIPGFTHHVMIVELFSSLRQLGREQECLKLIKYHDRIYTKIKLESDRPWVLMKMRKYKNAKALAQRFLGQKRYVMSALNALCAINFEQNKRADSLTYCRKAYLLDRKRKDTRNRSVHSINLAEAYLSLFDLSQAEKYALDATKHFHRYLHSTPWEFLVGLYLDLGRFNDAWNALRQSRHWYMQQAPKLSESVYAGNQMTQSVFFLAMGEPQVSLKILERIRDRPDRRGHMSGDLRQFVVAERLLRREAQLLLSEQIREEAATKGFGARLGAWFRSQWLHFLAWRDGASARRQMADEVFLLRSLSPYRSGSFSMPNSSIPYWMVGSVVPLMGPAVVRNAIEIIRAKEAKQTPKIRPFLLALEAEAAYHQGSDTEALVLLQRALQRLPARITPIRGRLHTIEGELARRNGKYTQMRQSFARVLRQDGSPFRQLRIPLPVAQVGTAGKGAASIAGMLMRSPRLTKHYEGFVLQVRSQHPNLEVTLVDKLGSVLHRFRLRARRKEKALAFQRRFVTTFQKDLFSPHFRLTRKQIFSLDDSLLRGGASPLPVDPAPSRRTPPSQK